jgi:histidinol-phosphate aminotransferase
MNNFITERARTEIFTIKPYVPGKPIDEVKRELGLDDIIKLASNENPLGPSPLAVQAIRQMVDQLHLYPDSNCFYLKEKLASVNNIENSGVIVGNGSDELLKLISECFLNKDDEILFGQPSFSEYEFTALIMGAKCIAVPLNDFTHDLDAMLAAITPKTKLLYICNPNNPTGTTVNGSEIAKFMQKVPDNVLVIFDEAYCEYVENEEFTSGLKYVQEGRNVIVLRTFSKIYGLAALRIGYGLTTPELAGAIERVMEPFNVNSVAQIGALAALEDLPHVKRSQELNAQGKKYLYEQFENLGFKYVPTEANFIFVDIKKNCKEVFAALLKEGVIVRTGDIFGYPNFIRVTIGTPEENERFIKSLTKVLEV